MKLQLLIGLAALLALCGNASGYFYIYGDTQVLPGETANVELCGWDSQDVEFYVYRVETGTFMEFLGYGDMQAALREALMTSPVQKRVFKSLNTCENIELSGLKRGMHILYAKSKTENQTDMLLVSELGLVTKSSKDGTMAYAVNLKGGKQMGGVEIKVYKDQMLVDSGTTDGNGVYDTEVNGSLAIIGRKGDDLAVISPYWYGWYGENSKTYIYTDRPVYRPSQDVYFKAIMWKKVGNGYQAARGVAKVQIKDTKDNLVYEKNLSINDFGSISGKFSLGAEPPLGYYSIYITADGMDSGYGSFNVEEYKKPEYQVTVTSDRETYIRGDTVRAEVDASYYFGSPVTDADVEYTISESGWWRPCYGYKCYYMESSYPYWGGEVINSGTGKIGPDGKMTINFVPENDQTSTYNIQVKVTDKSRRVVDGSLTFVVAGGEFDWSISTDKYSYKKGDNVQISVKSLDLEGKGISAYGKLKIEQHEWNSDWTKEKVTTIYEEGVETGSDGEALIDFVPDVAGSFYITIEGKDSRGNNVTGQGYFYVSDEAPRWDYWASLELTLDEEVYEAGDKAELIIKSPVADFTALVTVEADDVLDYYVKSFEGTTGSIEIPVSGEYKPNVDVYAMVVRNKTQYSSSVRLIVPPEDKFLNISISTDKEQYLPGEEGVFTVTVRDINGDPVECELSLGIVDESIYAIMEESVEGIDKFFYGPRWSTVSTQTSWSYWGNVLYEGMAADVEQAVGGRAPTMAAAPAEEAGGMSKARGLVAPQTRRYFPDTAFWLAQIRTDSNGQAKATVKMPDSLTTWRATARAIDKSFRVGQETEKTITRKNLLVRLETPRFFTQNDELLISGVVHNYLANTKEVVVELRTDDVTVQGEKTQTIAVAPGADERVDWKITADSCCKANITVRALTNEESDAMEMIIPIVPHGVKEEDAWAGSMDKRTESVTKNILVPEESIHGATELTLTLSPSIASTAFDALEYLASYPYGCVEQTMSAFLPDVYLARILKSLGMENEKLEKELPDMVSQGLQKLYEMQHSDGGWGWWENDDTHPYMTAYAVYGLTEAKNAGFLVSSSALQRGLDSLRSQYESGAAGGDFGGGESGKKTDANMRAYMAYSLSFHETPKSYPEDSELNAYGLALKTLARLNRGEDVGFPAKLRSGAICDELMCHWSAETFHYSWNSNDVETTAFALMALVKTEPDNEMAEKAVRWLVSNRRGNYWYSTKDTATAVFSLAEYLKTSRELTPDYTVKVYLNGELVNTVKKDDAFDMDNSLELEPKTGQNEIRLEKDGEGKLYYAVYLKYFKEEEGIKAKSSGITVDREYNVTTLKSGEYITVKLKIDVPQNQEYIILEDPIPAGCEVVEETPEIMPYYDYWGPRYWPYWYSQREARDEKVVYFMTYLYPGQNEVSYTLRAEVPGQYHVMPASAWNMYDEKIRGHSAEDEVSISDKAVVRISDVVISDDKVEFTVDALKLAEGELSGEVVVRLMSMDNAILKETREYMSVTGASGSKKITLPIALEDGLYTISYSMTTSDGDVISGSKRIQVGVAVEPVAVQPTVPTTVPTAAKPPEANGDKTLLIGVLVALLVLFAGLALFKRSKRPVRAKAEKAEAKAGAPKPKESAKSKK